MSYIATAYQGKCEKPEKEKRKKEKGKRQEEDIKINLSDLSEADCGLTLKIIDLKKTMKITIYYIHNRHLGI